MKKNIITYLILVFGITLLSSGCARKLVFTESEKTELDKKGIELGKVQFFNEETIYLRRILDEKEIRTARGIVKQHNDIYSELIKIRKHTPGILLGEKEDILKIAFEDGDTSYLEFKKPKGWGKYFRLGIERYDFGKQYVLYDGVEYEVEGQSKLLFKKWKRHKMNHKYRVAKGRRVNGFLNLRKDKKDKDEG